MQSDACPLFTSRHANHSAVWTVPGFSIPKFCLACATERLEDKGQISLHHKRVLGELQALLAAGNSTFLQTLSSDKRALEHLSFVVFGLLLVQDVTVSQSAIEVLGTLANQVSSSEIPRKLMQKTIQMVMTSQSFSMSLPHLTFLGRLLHAFPTLCIEMAHLFGGFLEYLLNGLAYPEEMVKSAVAYVLVQLSTKTPQNSLPMHLVQSTCKLISTNLASARSHDLTLNLLGGFLEYLLNGLAYPEEMVKSAVAYVLVQLSTKTPQNSLPMHLVQSTCKLISTNLASARSHDLTLNLLGLVKGLLRSDVYTHCLLQTDKLNSEAKGSTLASAFKRVLLSRDELLQLSGVQCVAEVLTHHPQYGSVLLQADIAEFMFEALTSRKELLMISIFLCLNSLSSVDDFYSKGHIIYGIEQVIVGLSTTLTLKNYNATQLGFTFLSKVFSRQPVSMPLFTNAEAFQKLLDVFNSALQCSVSAVVLNASITFSCLLCIHHLPSGLSLKHFLPHLSLLVHHLESLSSEERTQKTHFSPSEAGQLLTNIFSAMERMNKICLDIMETKNGRDIPEDLSIFLFISFEENILPALLVNAENLHKCEPFASVFRMAQAQFQLHSTLAPALARRLAATGFISFAFDVKSRFFPTSSGADLCSSVNECIESLCYHMEADPERKSYTKDILHPSLPDINCGLEKSLDFLTQRAGSLAYPALKAHSDTLTQTQRAVLAVLYYSHVQCGSFMLAHLILQGLNKYLVLNPDVHLLPTPSLTHLTVLYALSLSNITSTKGSLQPGSEGSQILVRALLRVPSPASVFVPHSPLIQWAFTQQALHSIARLWFSEWLKCLCGDEGGAAFFSEETKQNPWASVAQLFQTSPNALDVLLDPPSTGELCLSTLSLVDHLLSEVQVSQQLDNRIVQKVISYLQRTLLAQRLQPLSDADTSALLKLMVKAFTRSSVSPNLKIVYHAINFVTRCHTEVVVNGLNFLHEITSDTKDVELQVLVLLLNNVSFIRRLVSLVPRPPSPQNHSPISASALQLISTLIHHQHRTTLSHTATREAISCHSVMASLIHHLPNVQVSGLFFWQTVLSTGGYTGCFVLELSNRTTGTVLDVSTLKRLTFLIQNCLVKDSETVKKAAALCFAKLLQYITDKGIQPAMVQLWNQTVINHLTTLCFHSHIPSYYLPCLSMILSQIQVVPHQWHQLKDIAQLLYKSLATEQQPDLPNYASCFTEIRRIDSSSLDEKQWAHLNTIITIT